MKNDITRLNLKFRNLMMKQKEEYSDYIENEEESIIEKTLNKWMEA